MVSVKDGISLLITFYTTKHITEICWFIIQPRIVDKAGNAVLLKEEITE